MDELLEQFLIEGRELVAQASDDLIALERHPLDSAHLDSLFRAIHTLKGSVALFDFAPMGVALHAAEDLLVALRSNKAGVSRSIIDALLGCVDTSERWVESIARTGRLPPTADREGRELAETLLAISVTAAVPDEQTAQSRDGSAASGLSKDGAARTVRVDAARIDALVDLVGELIITKNSLGHLAAQANEENFALANVLTANVAGLERLTSDMQRAVMSLRMTPLSRIFSRFPRWMRDVTTKLGKVVEFEIRDEGVEADKSIVDGLFEPLLHILRNAADHGIEAADLRRASGKQAAGHITLEAHPAGDQIVISVSDDGAGLDPERLRNIAKMKGLIGDEALDDAAAIDLIFIRGFSSSDTVTDISGRGVGMDVVRTAVEALGGQLSVTSALGSGTTIELKLPQAVLATTVIMARVGQESFGVPIERISETCRIPRERILPIRDGRAFVLRDRTLPLLRLSDLLQLPHNEGAGADCKVLIVSSGGQHIGVEIDGLGQRLDVLLRPTTGLLSGIPGVIGTALLGDGRVLLVIDLPTLIG